MDYSLYIQKIEQRKRTAFVKLQNAYDKLKVPFYSCPDKDKQNFEQAYKDFTAVNMYVDVGSQEDFCAYKTLCIVGEQYYKDWLQYKDIPHDLNVEYKAKLEVFTNQLDELYEDFVGKKPMRDFDLNKIVLEALDNHIDDFNLDSLREFLREHLYLSTTIKSLSNLRYRYSFSLFVFYMVYVHPKRTYRQWPLNNDEINSFYKILGISMTHL